MNIAQILNDYLEALQTRGLSAALNPAATPEEIKNFENEHGIHLPELFIQLYQRFNGQMNELIPPSEPRWLGLEEIFSKQQDWQDFCQTHYGKQWKKVRLNPFDAQELVKNTLFHPFWLPFMADEGGFYCLDYDPDHRGQTAQVIYAHLQTSLEKTNIIHLADNFGIWFENHVQAFQARQTAVTLQTLLTEYLYYQKSSPLLALNPPADIAEIRSKESFLMVEFPHSLIEIWSAFNGYKIPDPFGGDYWIPLDQIETIQQQWREQLIIRLGRDPEKTIRPNADETENVQPYYYNPLWIPVYKNQTIIVALDFDPVDQNNYGQPLIIYNQFNYVISADLESFDEWLYLFLSYALYPEEDNNLNDIQLFTSEILTHYQYYLGLPDDGFDVSAQSYDLNLLWFKKRSASAVVTCGNSQHIFKDQNDDSYGIEFMIFLPIEKSQAAEENNLPQTQKWTLNVLAMASQILHSSPPQAPLEENCLIPVGEAGEVLEGTDFTGFLVIHSHYLLPPEFYQHHNENGEKIKILLLIPLYPDEIDFIIHNDIFELIDVIVKKPLETLADLQRPSLLSDL